MEEKPKIKRSRIYILCIFIFLQFYFVWGSFCLLREGNLYAALMFSITWIVVGIYLLKGTDNKEGNFKRWLHGEIPWYK